MIKSKYIIIIIFINILIFNCSDSSFVEIKKGKGKIVISTPEMTGYPFKSISKDYNTQIDETKLNKNNFRYDVIVESGGKRIQQVILKNNSNSTIVVPAGIPLDIFVGLYYAKNSTTDDELYNVYLAHDKKEGIVLMADDTEKLSFTLDLKEQSKVTTYYNTAFVSDIASFTGGAFYSDRAYFSIYPLEDDNDSKILQISASSFTNAQNNVPYNGRGVLSSVADSLFWYAFVNGLYHTDNMGVNLTAYGFNVIENRNMLSKTLSIKSCNIAGYSYYFINHIDGYFGLVGTASAGITNIHYIDMSGFSNLFPSYTYLLDVAAYSFGNFNMGLIATKNGLFLVSQPTMDDYATGNIDDAIAGSKKLIRIPNSVDHSSILITGVKIVNNILYLSTTQGVYYLDMSKSDWINFRDPNDGSFKIYDSDNIKRFKDFKTNEPVVFMNTLLDENRDNILIIATNKRIYIKNIDIQVDSTITVMDGLPFVPLRKFKNTIVYNNTYYRIHDTAPIRNIFYNSVDHKFWICTDFGLGSVNKDDLY